VAVELELCGVTKRFPGVLANDRIDLRVDKGEIHAVMGENGAGKSTLMSILYGLIEPDEGEIWVRGERRRFASPSDAIAAGLGMVFQSFKLFGSMTVGENVVFGQEPTRRGLIDQAETRRRVAAIAERYGLALDPDARVDRLPVGVRQRVEIVKALYRDASVLILDEPTAVLTPQEADRLFEVLRALADDGRTIIFITHKLNEVMALADRVTVLRDGRSVARLVTSQTTPTEITRHMTGRDIDPRVTPAGRPPGAVVLRCTDLCVHGEDGRVAVDGVSLEVRAGEIVGIAGVAGNGQAELIAAIAGLRSAASGRVELAGRDITKATVSARRAAGLSYIPEDRHAVGTAGPADVAANLAMGHHRRPPLLRRGLLQPAAIAAHARTLIERFQIKVAGPGVRVDTLSGGNLQKVAAARELAHGAPLLIAEQPTRGVDVGAIEFIHGQLTEYRDRGGAVLLVSAELVEILSLATRVLVMFEGRVVAVVDAADADEATLGLLMMGVDGEMVGRHVT
jgi:simple sugar transport system ATP-binding protein